MEKEIKGDPKNNNNKRRGRRTNSPSHRSSSKQSGGKTAHMHHTSFYTAQGCFQVWLHMHTDGSALRAEAGAILGVERARRLNAGQWSTVGCQNEILSLVHEESDFFLVVCVMLMDLINQLQLQQHMKGAVLQHGPLKNTHLCLLSLAVPPWRCLSTAAMLIFSREMRHQSRWSTERDSHPLNWKKVRI